MSAEHNLPPELAGFEKRLRQQPLDTSVVDRDSLMYQAGWAAAEASRKQGWLWPTTSGVLAASVLVLAGLLVGGGVESDRVAEVPAVETNAVEPAAAEPEIVAVPKAVVVEVSRQPRWRSALQTMRLREMHRQYQQPFSLASSEDDLNPKTMTARQLMQELLGETS